jgi:dienelactone hydrolase
MMDRREFLNRTTTASFALGFSSELSANPLSDGGGQDHVGDSAPKPTLPGTAPLTVRGDMAEQMVDGIHHLLLRRTKEAAGERPRLWNRNYGSAELYSLSVSPNRERFRQIVGAVDRRLPASSPELVGSIATPPLVSTGDGYKVFAVRWSVLGSVIADFGGLDAEGLLLQPETTPVARVVAVPDADWTPEMLVGLAPGVPTISQFARRYAENGCQVLVPLIVNRDDTFSGIPGIGFTNEPHREWLYRMSFEVGRHVIGYEIQKILAAVDWFTAENAKARVPIGVVGYGEGGLLALYCAALDARIDATVVSGHFQEREAVWKEPIYRDVWGLAREFGDAELARLILPRALVVEACRGPEVNGPPPAREEHRGGACPNGKLATPPLDSVRREVERARLFFAGLKLEHKLRLVESDAGEGPCGSEGALREHFGLLGLSAPLRPAGNPPADARQFFDPNSRLQRQFSQMVGFTQALIRQSPQRRKEFWAKANSARPVASEFTEPPWQSCSSQWSTSPENWRQATKFHRDYIWEEVFGRLPSPSLPANPRTRLIYDQPKYHGYEVMLDVWPDVFAYGILLVPKNIKEGERRPAVVCQHGLEGRPQDVADASVDSHFYHRFAVRLAEEGFVTYAPQNPYIGDEHFRIIQRMAHPLKLSMFSFILGQHEQTLKWLGEQPFVDASRIGLYGLSYGGVTAVRVPPLLDGYALSICSANYNEWVWKTTSVESPRSYLLGSEYEMCDFDFANIVNYAELSNLIAPRPFMVERGIYDGVESDEWVNYEYGKVRWFYSYMGIPDRTEIEFFEGEHEIHGVKTFEFLRRHLNWGKPDKS